MVASHLSSFPKTLYRWHNTVFQVHVAFLTPSNLQIDPRSGNNIFLFPEEGYLLAIPNESTRRNTT